MDTQPEVSSAKNYTHIKVALFSKLNCAAKTEAQNTR